MVKVDADKCSECGTDHPAVSNTLIWLPLIVGTLLIMGLLKACQGGLNDELSIEDQQRRGFHCLHSWDGAHVEFMRDVKSKMRDPASFKHVETRITAKNENGKHVIFMDYRAKNGFGGVNTSTAKGVVDNASCRHTIIQLE